MKHLFEITVLSLLPLIAHGQHNNNTLHARGSFGVKVVHVDQILMQMERDWARAIVSADTAKIREILAAEVVLTAPDGTVLSREDDLAELASGEFKADVFDAFDMNVKVYGDCAVVIGQTRVKGKYKGKNVQDRFRWTDTFVKRKGRWQIIASQATSIARPRGRAAPDED